MGGAPLRVHGEARPCFLLDDALPGLRRALEPDGVFCEVLADAAIALGDEIGWEE